MKMLKYTVLVAAAIAVGFLLGQHHTHKQNSAQGARRVLYYVDPMHPNYKSDKPGIAPDCGMPLEPVFADEGGAAPLNLSTAVPLPAGTVNIDPQKQQLFGIEVTTVQKTSGTRTLRIPGRVAPEDMRVYRLNAGTDGYIKETHDDSVGSFVKKDQKLASFYSQDFAAVISGFLSATERNTGPGFAQNQNQRGRDAYSDRLRNLGMSDLQIRELAATRQIPDSIYVVSPVDGFIVERNISPSQTFEKRTEFYRIADLSEVWILADIFSSDAETFRPGAMARVTLPDQDKSFTARVSNVLPQVDPTTRSLKLRLEAGNPGFALRPDMFVQVELPVQVPAGLSVPVDAVLDSGISKRVFVDRGNGYFEPREVETGWRFGERVQIVKGLSEGERVVSAGSFLVDSESRLKSSAIQGAPKAPASESPKQPKTQKTVASGMVKDAKCGMSIDPVKAAAAGNTLTLHGTTYYFCSQDCKEKFRKEPERYLASNH